MPHINLPGDKAGIVSLFEYNPITGRLLNQLADELLNKNATDSYTAEERELVGTYVSYLNHCNFCYKSHKEMVNYFHGGNDDDFAEMVCKDIENAPVRDKVKAFLKIAEKVHIDARNVTAEDIERARSFGATDDEIHDTVLIAAAFSLYNRYVDGLKTVEWGSRDIYKERARLTAEGGYFHDS